MLVTFLGIVISVRAVQPSKALMPIVTSESGRSIDGRFLQPLKDFVSMVFNPDGSTTLVSEEQFSHISDTYVICEGNLSSLRLIQPLSAPYSIFSTLSGISILSRALRPLKEFMPM